MYQCLRSSNYQTQSTHCVKSIYIELFGFGHQTAIQWHRKNLSSPKFKRDVYMIFKPDKGQGIILINKADYSQSLKWSFGDRKKFQVLNHNSTLTNLATIGNYIQTIDIWLINWYNKHSSLWCWKVFDSLIKFLKTKCLFNKGFVQSSRPYLFNTNQIFLWRLLLFFFPCNFAIYKHSLKQNY